MSLELIALALLGFAVGAYGTIIGAGGGFILVPLLLLLYPGYGPEEVTSISLAVVFANATSGSIAYARAHRIDYPTGLLFAASSAPGVIGGAIAVHYVPERLFSGLFGALMLILAYASIRSRPSAIRDPVRGPGILHRHMHDREGREYVYAYPIWQGALLSLAVGFMSSLFGTGGGVVHVPAMIIMLHIPAEFAVATSHFVIAFIAGGGSSVHIIDGSLGGSQAVKALALAAGAIPGAQLGAYLAHHIKGRIVLQLLAGAIVLLGVRLLLKSIFSI